MRLSDVLQLQEKAYTPKGNGVQGKIMSVGPAVQKGDWYSQPITLLGIDNTQSPLEHSSKRPDSMLNQSHSPRSAATASRICVSRLGE